MGCTCDCVYVCTEALMLQQQCIIKYMLHLEVVGDDGSDDLRIEHKVEHGRLSRWALHARGQVTAGEMHADQVLQGFLAGHGDLE